MKFSLLRVLAFCIGVSSLAIFYLFCFPVLRLISKEPPVREVASHAKPEKPHTEAKTGEGHGEKKEGAEKEVTVNPKLFSLGEVIVHVPSPRDERNHSLGMKVELEFFEEDEKDKVKEYLSVVKDSIIQVSMERDYFNLMTLPGKYAFKESIVEKINASFREPLIKDVHFTAFLLK